MHVKQTDSHWFWPGRVESSQVKPG